jgi:deoxyribonuclease V
MKIHSLHPWDMSIPEGQKLQERLADSVRLCPLPKKIRFVAGADMSFRKEEDLFFAGVVVLRFPSLDVVEEVSAVRRTAFPYVPGMLSFREGPVLLDAFSRLKTEPDVVLFDGQGIAHPRRLGLASHLGLWLDLPSVGCAKSVLVGKHEPPGEKRGEMAPLLHREERVGVALRTRAGVKPMFISPGHLADFESSVEFVLRCCRGFRLPEPTRLADKLVARVKKEKLLGRVIRENVSL